MDIITTPKVISAFRHAHLLKEPAASGPEARTITRKAIADGWITPFDIDLLLVATDPRLCRLRVRELLSVFGIALQHVFERPARGARDAEGLERISVVDLARLLIVLERAGLAVDPMPLCTALAPALGAKRLLTAHELVVYWRTKGPSDEPMQFITAQPHIECGDTVCTTAAGYEVRGFYASEDGGDCAEMLIILPPTGPFRPAASVSRPARSHLRKYLGEPRIAPAPKPRRRRARSLTA